MAQNPIQSAAGLMAGWPHRKKAAGAMPFGYNPQGTSLPTWPDKPPVVNETPPILDYPPKPPIINETPPIIDWPPKPPVVNDTPPIIDLPGILNQKKKRRPVTAYNE